MEQEIPMSFKVLDQGMGPVRIPHGRAFRQLDFPIARIPADSPKLVSTPGISGGLIKLAGPTRCRHRNWAEARICHLLVLPRALAPHEFQKPSINPDSLRGK
uniref:Uncharacterized protein n=1 Tax=Magnetospirillum gryphiswaldense TaxID=55518 RepID=A4TUP8_9PROT|nr:hypothetical protein MGR_0196 [Magnetospirillum gryphiswaldense MSR-1]